MPKLLPLFPPHQLYVSVFGGSGTDILRKPPSRSEVFNDRHGEVTNFFRVLQDRREELLERLRVTPISRTQFEDCLRLLRTGEGDPVLRAWAFVTAANQCRNGIDPLMARPAWWSPSVHRRLLRWTELPERLLGRQALYPGLASPLLRHCFVSCWSASASSRFWRHSLALSGLSQAS